jgi:capsid protein
MVTFVSPARGLARMSARLQLASRGAYTGASTDEKALREYRTRLGSADADSVGDLPTLRSRTRDMARNNPVAAGAIATNVRNVIGTGLIPRPTPDAEYLGLTDDQASEWARAAERIFWTWAKSCDIERKQPFWAMQALVLQSELESGDIFTVRRYMTRPGDILGLKLQVIEADRVCNPGSRIRRGSSPASRWTTLARRSATTRCSVTRATTFGAARTSGLLCPRSARATARGSHCTAIGAGGLARRAASRISRR